MSTTTGKRPEPSDAAMAAARDYLLVTDPRKSDPDVAMLARFYDRVTAPLREELARLQADWQKVVKETLACDPISACKRADDQLEPPWEVVARLRASNDKLRAALDWAIAWVEVAIEKEEATGANCKNLRAFLEKHRAALAPERKETT